MDECTKLMLFAWKFQYWDKKIRLSYNLSYNENNIGMKLGKTQWIKNFNYANEIIDHYAL